MAELYRRRIQVFTRGQHGSPRLTLDTSGESSGAHAGHSDETDDARPVVWEREDGASSASDAFESSVRGLISACSPVAAASTIRLSYRSRDRHYDLLLDPRQIDSWQSHERPEWYDPPPSEVTGASASFGAREPSSLGRSPRALSSAPRAVEADDLRAAQAASAAEAEEAQMREAFTASRTAAAQAEADAFQTAVMESARLAMAGEARHLAAAAAASEFSALENELMLTAAEVTDTEATDAAMLEAAAMASLQDAQKPGAANPC
mmetsp:Transcript_4782/g.14439  ORF Transcript_4782/g.14439 Transcript_4782/m.14439 type:complete len:264 (+) Transcript_4782:44-835(+)